MTNQRHEVLPKLLRAIANGDNAKRDRHDIILNAAADEIERLTRERNYLLTFVQSISSMRKKK